MQYEVNLAGAHWKAAILNKILPPLQEQFEDALHAGVILELEQSAMSFVDKALEEAGANAGPR